MNSQNFSHLNSTFLFMISAAAATAFFSGYFVAQFHFISLDTAVRDTRKKKKNSDSSDSFGKTEHCDDKDHIKCRNMITAERRGRIKAEQLLRQKVFERIQSPDVGYPLLVIGKVRSTYLKRRGTPRQGLLVPDSRAVVILANEIPKETLEGLETYSHMFIQFIFNENTNIVKTLLTAGSNQDDESTLSSRASASKSSTFSQKVHSFASRVLPPLLGHPLGLFATRSPHRPNALGLSLCRIEKVDIENRSVEISGADLVDGSLVVDLKPWGPFDCPKCLHDVVDHDGIKMSNCESSDAKKQKRCQLFKPRVPDWVLYNLSSPYKLEIKWSSTALDSLSLLVLKSNDSSSSHTNDTKSKFYPPTKEGFECVKRAIEQVLSLDIRSLHRGKGGEAKPTILDLQKDRQKDKVESKQGKKEEYNQEHAQVFASDLVVDRAMKEFAERQNDIGAEINQSYEVDFDVYHIGFIIKSNRYTKVEAADLKKSVNVWILVETVEILTDESTQE